MVGLKLKNLEMKKVGFCCVACGIWFITALDYVGRGVYYGGLFHNLKYTNDKVLEIPDEIWGRTIKSVICEGLLNIETVIIPNTVTELGEGLLQVVTQ